MKDRKYFRTKKDKENSVYEAVTVYMPRSLAETLGDISIDRGIPKSRLICYAIDNELDQETPFNYPHDLPDQVYVEFAYAKEAQMIVDYMRKCIGPVGRDLLMLARRDIGIKSREDVLLGYRECVMQGVIEERHDVDSKFKFWNKDYMHGVLVRLKAKSKKVLNPLIGENEDGPST